MDAEVHESDLVTLGSRLPGGFEHRFAELPEPRLRSNRLGETILAQRRERRLDGRPLGPGCQRRFFEREEGGP